jgi:hypothetical protein
LTDGPEARIRAGSPTPEEEAVIVAAIDKIWREERAKAAVAAGPSPWVTASRIEGTRAGVAALRGPRAWRLSGILGGDAPTPTQTGRGDAK